MLGKWRKALHLFESSRLDLLLGVVSNLWLMVFLAFSIEPDSRQNSSLKTLGIYLSLSLTALIAAGVTTFALSLNDVLDVRYDRSFFPARPLPAGQLRKRWAVLAGALAFAVAFFASLPLGEESVIITLVASFAVVFYNFVGRFVPAAGVITLAVMYGLAMGIPNPHLGFAWPIALTVTHIFACAAMRRTLPGSRPRLKSKDAIVIVIAWVFISMMLAGFMNSRNAAVLSLHSPTRWIWTGPLAAFLLFIPVAVRLIQSQKAGTRAGAQRFAQTANLWLLIYPPLWLFAGQQYAQGGVLGSLLVIAILWRRIVHWLRMHMPGHDTNDLGYRLDVDRPL